MSRLNTLLTEVKNKLVSIDDDTISLRGRVVIAYNEDDLLDLVKGIKSYPAVGIVYEGMRSMVEKGSTAKSGLSSQVVFSLVIIEQGSAIVASDQKRSRAIDYLEAMRDVFLTDKSATTGHMWHFLVEAPAALKAGMVCWVQRWGVPIQLLHSLPQDVGPLPVVIPLPKLQTVYPGASTRANTNQQVSFAFWFDRPLVFVPTPEDRPVTLTVYRVRDGEPLTLYFDTENSAIDTTVPGWEDFAENGGAQLIFESHMFTPNQADDYELRDDSVNMRRWSHFRDKESNLPIRRTLEGLT